eukprot:gene15124-biopygen3649
MTSPTYNCSYLAHLWDTSFPNPPPLHRHRPHIWRQTRGSTTAPKRESVRRPRKSVRRPHKSVRRHRESVRRPRKIARRPHKSVRRPRKSVRRPRKSVSVFARPTPVHANGVVSGNFERHTFYFKFWQP